MLLKAAFLPSHFFIASHPGFPYGLYTNVYHSVFIRFNSAFTHSSSKALKSGSVWITSNQIAAGLEEKFYELKALKKLQNNESQTQLVRKLNILHKQLVECQRLGVFDERLAKGLLEVYDQLGSKRLNGPGLPFSGLCFKSNFKETLFNFADALFSRIQKIYSQGLWSSKNSSQATENIESKLGIDLCKDVFPQYEKLKCLYIWGGVGQGKTMLMDLFFNSLCFSGKGRYHFHSFMLEVHKQLHSVRELQLSSEFDMNKNGNLDSNDFFKLSTIDPILAVAYSFALKNKFICLDEFQVVHIADAMILRRLVESLWHFGCVILVTSNRCPSDLYLGGLNRERFLPLIKFIETSWDVFNVSAGEDFRKSKDISSKGVSPSWSELTTFHCPSRSLDKILSHMVDVECSQQENIKLSLVQVGKSRTITIPYSLNKSCCLSFHELCSQAVGAQDYLALAECYSTIFLYSIPSLGHFYEQQNEIRRFIELIDVFYEKNTRVFFDAEVPLLKIFGSTSVTDSFDYLLKAMEKYSIHGLEKLYSDLKNLQSIKQATTGLQLLDTGFSSLLGLNENSERNLICSVLKTAKWNPPSFKCPVVEEAMYLLRFGAVNPSRWVFFSSGFPFPQNEEQFKYGSIRFNFNSTPYDKNEGMGFPENHFAAERCLSRVYEMLTEDYQVQK